VQERCEVLMGILYYILGEGQGEERGDVSLVSGSQFLFVSASQLVPGDHYSCKICLYMKEGTRWCMGIWCVLT
jgi:hypothetical protein